MPFDFSKELINHNWQPDKIIKLIIGSYRHRVDIICSEMGKHSGKFKNGEYFYGACVRLLRSDGSEISDGNCIVPRLPDYRFLMVLERRPAIVPNGELAILNSLEFPGGAIDGESITLGCLRECREETGIPTQEATFYRRLKSISPMSSDVICRNYYGILLLTKGSFDKRVLTDGGLEVVALTEKEVGEVMWDGTVTHGPSQFAWQFYKEVIHMDPVEENWLIRKGWLSREKVTI